MEIKNKSKKNILNLFNSKTKCPTCKKKSKDPYAPFCSKQCADIDLIKWLSEEHGENIKT